jgi:hypothetical protein
MATGLAESACVAVQIGGSARVLSDFLHHSAWRQLPLQPADGWLTYLGGRSHARLLVGAKWGAVVGRHLATWSLLGRSIP